MIETSTKNAFQNSLNQELGKTAYAQGAEGVKVASSFLNAIEENKKKKKKETTMKLPIGKLTSMSGKSESKEATGSGSAGGYVPALEGKSEKLKGGKSDHKTFQDLVNKNKRKGKDIGEVEKELKKQLNKGIKVEMEHTDDKGKAKEIAMDHLFEDPKYYDKLEKIEKKETKEATGSGSAGSYETTSIWAKSTNKKDWKGARKPLYKGGKFVTVKKKCKTFPYCNQGDIKALKIYENKIVKKVIDKISKEQNINENVIKAIIQNQIENNRNIIK